jgi:hypothetical protein
MKLKKIIEKKEAKLKKKGSIKLPKFFFFSLEFILSIIAYPKQLAGGGNRDKSERIEGNITFKLELVHSPLTEI